MAKGKWILQMATNTQVIGSITLGQVKASAFMLMVIAMSGDIHKSFINLF
jgi:hypothetical protein